MALITATGAQPDSVRELVRDAAVRAVIGAQINSALRSETQAHHLAGALVDLCEDVKAAAQFQLELDSDAFGADAISDADWQRGCASLNNAVRNHVQSISHAAYHAVHAAFWLGLRAGAAQSPP
jgi:hypothetical protein